MNRFFAHITLIMVSLGIPFFALANGIDPMNLPKISQFIEDYSSLIPSDQLTELRKIAENHEKNTTEQAVVVLFPNRNGYELADIGLKIFRENGIGQKNIDNGVLLLIATEEKKIRIITGYGMDGNIPDTLAKRWIEEDIRPRVNVGDYYGAVQVFYENVIKISGTNKENGISLQKTSDNGTPEIHESIFEWIPLILSLMFVCCFFVIPAVFVSHIIKSRLKKELRQNGISVQEVKFNSTNHLLQSPTSTSWYNKRNDPSNTSYEKWDTENKSLSEHFTILGISKKGTLLFFVSILLSIIPSFLLLFVPIIGTILPLFVFSAIFYFLLSSSIQKSLQIFRESNEFEAYKNGESTLYDIVWLSPPSKGGGGSRGSSSGGGGFSGGGGSSGGGGAGD